MNQREARIIRRERVRIMHGQGLTVTQMRDREGVGSNAISRDLKELGLKPHKAERWHPEQLPPEVITPIAEYTCPITGYLVRVYPPRYAIGYKPLGWL